MNRYTLPISSCIGNDAGSYLRDRLGITIANRKTWCACWSQGVRRNFSNNSPENAVPSSMSARVLGFLAVLVLIPTLPAQTCREVVRDSSGRIVQTIDHQKQSGGTVQTTTRDAAGRIIGTATTRTNSGGFTSTQYRDASGRITGSAATQPRSGGTASNTTYRDASGRIQGNASSRTSGGAGTTTTEYRDASGRLSGTSATNGKSATTATSTRRDASGRITGTSTANGKCPGPVKVPVPITTPKK